MCRATRYKVIAVMWASLILLFVARLGLGQASATANAPSPAAPENSPTMEVSPARLEFGAQVVASTSPVHTATVSVTAGNDVSVKIVATFVGDFDVVSKGCEFKGSGSCAIGVTFSPKQSGETEGALTVGLSANG